MLARRRSFIGFLSALTLCAAASQASAATYDNLFVFGDSTVDSGWWAGALAIPAQCDGVAVPCATGSNGKNTVISNAIAAGGSPPANGAPVGAGNMNNVQDLGAKFGLTANPANQPGGTNYAISGALSAPVSGSGNLNPNTNLPSTMTQIANYLSTHSNVADPSALYVISSGGNDVTYAQDNFTTTTAQRNFLSGQAIALASQIATLQTKGANSIVVYGLQGGGMLSTFMTGALFTDLKTDGVNFLGINIAGLIAAVQADPSAYNPSLTTVLIGTLGAGNTQSACVFTGAAPTTGWGQWCANTTTPSSSYAYLRTANAEQTSLFSDDQHLSAAGQQIEANFVFNELTSPVPAALPLFATGLGALGLLGWRRKRKAQAVA
jgi:outer membrane lipase/esterase